MIEETRTVEGDILVDYALMFHGMVGGNLTVVAGGHLEFHSMCGKDIIVESGAKVYMHGMVGMNVINRGGYLEVYGMIAGRVIEQDGETIIMPTAKIEGLDI